MKSTDYNISRPPDLYPYGEVIGISTQSIYSNIKIGSVNDICRIYTDNTSVKLGKIIQVTSNSSIIALFEGLSGISIGNKVINTMNQYNIAPSFDFLGSVIDGFGKKYKFTEIESIDSHKIDSHKNEFFQNEQNANVKLDKKIEPNERAIINKQFITGIKCIDTLMPLGIGQRIGIFASAGLGKTSLISQIFKNAEYDICVICLVGERGREVKEFLVNTISKDKLYKTTVVVSTSDESALKRQLSVNTASILAEYYRNHGFNVLLVIDSLTRFARAIRDYSFSAGEIPVKDGYPVTVFTELPKLLEKHGKTLNGSITAIYTILSETKNVSDFLSEEIKSLLDGHIILSNYELEKGIRPCIDFTQSLSRLSKLFTPKKYLELQETVYKYLRRIKNDKELSLISGFQDVELKKILEIENEINKFLNQEQNSNFSIQESWSMLQQLVT